MINVLINGINGRMGQEVLKQVTESDEFKICCGFDKFDNKLSFPTYTDIDLIREIPDIIIDFSIPEASINILEFAKQNNIPIVIATTGFSDEQLSIIEETSKNLPAPISITLSPGAELFIIYNARSFHMLPPESNIKPVQFFFREIHRFALIIDGICGIIYTVYFYRSETRHARQSDFSSLFSLQTQTL